MIKHRVGKLYIVAAPSGGGKTSLVKELINRIDNLTVSVSHTTREKRAGEEDGESYHFITESIFLKMLAEDAFIEHATVFEHYYGTSHAEIDERLSSGVDIILDIDWQGAAQIRKRFKNVVSIFILPPSLDILKQRLLNRQRDDLFIIEKRMQSVHEEMSHYQEFDYLVVNDDFNKALNELMAIVTAERLKIDNQKYDQQKLLSLLKISD